MRWICAAATAALVVLASCGGGDDPEAMTTTVTEPPLAEATTTTDPATTTTTTEPEGTSGAALATTDTTIAGRPMRVEITELVRQGELVTLGFTVTNTSGQDSETFYRSFDDSGNGTAADGLVLIDPANGREYRVVRTPEEGCLCSDELPFTLAGGQAINLSASFDAPAPDVAEANVNFPGSVGQLTGVPITG
jgi:hypothetical protein